MQNILMKLTPIFNKLPVLLLLAAASGFCSVSQAAPVGSLEGEADVNQGLLTYTLPLNAPVGINKTTAGLYITYNQERGNGIMGLGFSLAGLSVISRCGAQKDIDGRQGTVLFNASDVYCLDGERLVAVKGKNGAVGSEYRLSDNDFSKLIFTGSSWKVYGRDGYIYFYGAGNNSLLKVDGVITSWSISGREDRFGNRINYVYQDLAGSKHLSEINYSGHKIKLNYIDRPDRLESYRHGVKVTLSRLLGRIDMYHSGLLTHSYRFNYDTASGGFSRLSTVRMCDNSADCARPTVFKWSNDTHSVADQVVDIKVPKNFLNYQIADLNLDGYQDLCYLNKSSQLYCGLGTAAGGIGSFKVWSQGPGNSKWHKKSVYDSLMLVDINNDMYPDYCLSDEKALYCRLNNKGKNFNGGGGVLYSGDMRYKTLMDVNNDYLPDLCEIGAKGTYCRLNTGGRFSTNSRKLAASGWTKAEHASFMDINSDGLIDICGPDSTGLSCALNQGQGSDGLYDYAAKKLIIPGLTAKLLTNNDTVADTLRYGDLNADGLPDVCYRDNLAVKCSLNTGKVFTGFSTWLNLPAGYGEFLSSYDSSFALIDYDQDGRADLCTGVSPALVTEVYSCGLNNNSRFGKLAKVSVFYPGLEKITIAGKEVIPRHNPFRIADMNNDLVSDICYRSDKGISCSLNRPRYYGKLQEVTSGYGNRIVVAYGVLSDRSLYTPDQAAGALTVNLTPAKEVVRSISSSNGIGSLNRMSYKYYGLKYHKERGLLGFRKVVTTNEANNLVSSAEYHQSGELAGLIKSSDKRVNGSKTADASYGYEVITERSHPRIRRVRKTYENKAQYELNGSFISSTGTNFSNYDGFDNPGTIVKHTTGGGLTNRVTTTTVYNNNPADWLLGKAAKITVEHNNGRSPAIKRTTSFSYYPDGSLRQEIIEPGSKLALTSVYTYDRYGNRLSAAVSGSGKTRKNSSTYSRDGLYVISNTNALGHTESISYDRRCGLPSTQTGPNRLTTRWQYDGFCRKIKETRADGTQTVWSYRFAKAGRSGPFTADNSVYAITESSSGMPPKTVYYDSLGREVRSKTIGFDGKPVYQDNIYNAKGQITRATMPYYKGEFTGDNTHWVRTVYDAKGRTTAVYKPAKQGSVVLRYGYAGLVSWEQDGKGRRKTVRSNLQGKPIEVREGASRIIYSYDAIGNLVTSNANGYVISNSYDKRSHKVTMNDPSMGTWRYQYNAFGELVKQTNAKGQVTAQGYDALGRMVKQINSDVVTDWQYDRARYGIGKLHKMVNAEYNVPDPEWGAEDEDVSNSEQGTEDDASDEEEKKKWNMRRQAACQEISGENEDIHEDVSYKGLDTVLAILEDDPDYYYTDPSLNLIRELKGCYGTFEDYVSGQTGQAEEEGRKADDVPDSAPARGGNVPVPAWDADNSETVSEIVYTYDRFGRVINEARKIGEKVYHTGRAYDRYSRVKTVLLPNGVSYDNEYKHGRLSRITMPRRQIWDYDYLRLEKSLQTYTRQISELVTKVEAHRGKQIKYTRTANKFKLVAYRMQKSVDYSQRSLNRFNAIANRLQAKANSHQRAANYYRERAAYFKRRFGNMYFKPVISTRIPYGTMGGYHLRIRFEHPNHRHHYFYGYLRHVSTIRTSSEAKWFHLNGKAYPVVYYLGLARKHQVWANDYSKYANVNRRHARKHKWVVNYSKRGVEKYKALALREYKLARRAADEMRKYAADLNRIRNSYNHVQQALHKYRTSTDKVLIWAATGRDSAGRISGELAGNAYLTFRNYDPYNGNLREIKTGVDMNKPIRHLVYGYDNNANVVSRNDKVNRVSEGYVYDSLERLQKASLVSKTARIGYSYGYDIRGNMTVKSDTGTMVYNGKNRLVKLIRNDGSTSSYQYDANGNQIKGGGRKISWTSFNKVKRIQSGGVYMAFEYGADRSRARQIKITGGFREDTVYAGKSFENITRVDNRSGDVLNEDKSYIYAEGQMVAVHIRTLRNKEKEPDKFRYFHRDALESIDAITDSHGKVVERLSYDPFGKRRQLDGRPLAAKYKVKLTNRGYTGHEHLDDVGLIHMNARLYDAETARFISADTYIQAPTNGQNYNRYTYVVNNPLKYTDPSGHFFKKIVKKIKKVVRKVQKSINKVFSAITPVMKKVVTKENIKLAVAIAAAYVTAGTSLAVMGVGATTVGGAMSAGLYGQGLVAAFAGGFVAGGITTGTLEGALMGGFTAAVTAGVGHGNAGNSIFGGKVATALGHGVTKGAISEIRGGEFKDGFVGGVVGHVSGYAMGEVGGNGGGAVFGRTAIAAAAGGLTAEATGGSFEDGAFQAAMTHLFNSEMTHWAIEEGKIIDQELASLSDDELSGWVDQQLNFDSAVSIGISMEATIVSPWQSGGGGTVGLNLQLGGGNTGLYYYHPTAAASGGLEAGFTIFQVNLATGQGPWSGTFVNYEGHISNVNAGYFHSPNYSQVGISAGIWGPQSNIIPIGGAVTETNYIPIIGGR